MMILGKWRSSVENVLKHTLLVEYKEIVAKISESQQAIKHLAPRQDALAKLLEAYGWLADIEKLEADDDLATESGKSKGKKIEELTVLFFADNNNQWTRLSDVYVYLTEKGLYVGGKNPNSLLSAHLSNSELFEGDRTKGWRIKPEHFVDKRPKGGIRPRELAE
jgi:hypothetical protein